MKYTQTRSQTQAHPYTQTANSVQDPKSGLGSKRFAGIFQVPRINLVNVYPLNTKDGVLHILDNKTKRGRVIIYNTMKKNIWKMVILLIGPCWFCWFCSFSDAIDFHSHLPLMTRGTYLQIDWFVVSVKPNEIQ